MPCYPKLPPLGLCLYHWSPTTNRASIKKRGLVPGRPSLQGYWRPPYVAFADEPMLAWKLSGAMFPEIAEWDLWMVDYERSTLGGYEIGLDHGLNGRGQLEAYVKEYRVYCRVYKRDLQYVGSRSN